MVNSSIKDQAQYASTAPRRRDQGEGRQDRERFGQHVAIGDRAPGRRSRAL